MNDSMLMQAYRQTVIAYPNQITRADQDTLMTVQEMKETLVSLQKKLARIKQKKLSAMRREMHWKARNFSTIMLSKQELKYPPNGLQYQAGVWQEAEKTG
ncbi:MAG: hypothetical protein V3W04_11100 [Gammaproteobacteria bacterium]